MTLPEAHEDNKEVKLIPGKEGGGGSLNRFSLTCLPKIDALQKLLPIKNSEKRRLDSTCLMAFGSLKLGKLINVPYFEQTVSAGYPSSVDDPFKRHLDLSHYLIRHPKTVYYFKASGYSMINAGINHKDLLVVDTALKPKHRDVIIAVLNREFTLKRLYLEGTEIKLLSANPDYPSITVTKEMEFFVHGVVTTVIRTFNPLPYDNYFKDISHSNV